MISQGPLKTREFGQKFAKKLKGGEVLGLIGELGSGKTVFVQGLAKGLGIQEKITSPTFVVLKEYDISKSNHSITKSLNHQIFVHIDAYRVESLEDIKSVGIEDCLNRDDAIIVIEWAEKIKEVLSKDTIFIKFEHIDKNSRKISIKSHWSEVELGASRIKNT